MMKKLNDQLNGLSGALLNFARSGYTGCRELLAHEDVR
jgi:hypothetical protein